MYEKVKLKIKGYRVVKVDIPRKGELFLIIDSDFKGSVYVAESGGEGWASRIIVERKSNDQTKS